MYVLDDSSLGHLGQEIFYGIGSLRLLANRLRRWIARRSN
jgi:hypothetical protein